MELSSVMEHAAVGLKSCSECAAQMPDSAAFCPRCGRAIQSEAARAMQKLGLLRENLAGSIAYFTFLPALVFLFLDPYRRNPFVRFHSLQCLLFWLVSVAAAVLVRLFALLVLLIPVVGPLLEFLLITITALAALFIWLVLVMKAFQGEVFLLPVLGDLAEHYSNRLQD